MLKIAPQDLQSNPTTSEDPESPPAQTHPVSSLDRARSPGEELRAARAASAREREEQQERRTQDEGGTGRSWECRGILLRDREHRRKATV